MRYRRLWLAGLVILLLFSGVSGAVSASEFRQGDQCVIEADEVIETDIYVICNTLTIEGTINGDVIGGAWSASLLPGGHVNGDIWLIGGQLRVDGTLDDDLRFAGVDLDLTEAAALGDGSNVSALAVNVELWDGALLPGDLVVIGYQTIIGGTVNGDVHFDGSALVIEGTAERDVAASVGGGEASPSFIPFPFPFSVSFQPPGLIVRSGGEVQGDLNYTAPRPGNISGRIGGEINFTPDLVQPDITQAGLDEETRPLDVVARYLNSVLTDVLSLMAAGALIMILAPAWIQEPARLIPRNAAPSFGWGLILTLMAAPVSLLVLLGSILFLILLSAITLGGFTWMGLVLLLVVNTVLVGGWLFLILFAARLVISELIGRRLGRRLVTTTNRTAYNLIALLIGTTVYALLVHVPLPYVGLVINAIGIFIGLGALALHTRQLYQRAFRAVYPFRMRGSAEPAPTRTLPPQLERLRGHVPEPPPDSVDPSRPGMTDLPDGFSWWHSDE